MSGAPSSAELMIQLIDEIHRARGRLNFVGSAFNDPDGPAGFSMTVLTAVVGAVHPPTVPQIGRSLGYPRQTVQRQAEYLVERGLITFIDNPDHKRARRMVATEAGKATHVRANTRSLAWAADFTRDMDPKRLTDAVSTLQMIRTRIESNARGRAKDACLEDNE
jgi:DNA-binding MarR family transcriptional regulator